jgi:antitoxin component YwqK of YwqJK toxin-antitoxin module
MNKILIILSFVVLASCGPSAEEKRQVEMEQDRIEQEKRQVELEQQRIEKDASERLAHEKAIRIAAVTCSIMSETRNMDAAIRVREMNDAREKIGGEPFLRGDSAIQEAFEYGLCQELVLDESYDETLQPLKDAKRERERIAAEKLAEEKRIATEKQRIAEEKLAEEKRLAAEKLAEENRIVAEKQRIADSKPTVKEEFYSNGKLKSRANYQPKSHGGKKHGLFEVYHENGKLQTKENWKDGKLNGLWEIYFENGQLYRKSNWKDGKEEGLREFFTQNGQLQHAINYKDGKADGLFDTYHNDGKLNERKCYKNGDETDMSYCEK